ncbi:MAG: ATPase, T2SS/T4P/T4SS family [Verrucomicrobia bacterium]|nr:ATPase, T2SS/T4P/T4SS family [Verrucomicrobiota bacterium]MDA1087585.1 ATPase, T2SS/T4P/T4SS family [Verrucomicrobiota bacterium]
MASARQDVRAGAADESSTAAAASGAAIAERYGLEFLASIEPASLDPDLIRELPVEWARTNVILPIRIGHRPCALTSDPTQVNQCEYLSLLLGQDVQPVVSTRELILRAIEKCYFERNDTTHDLLKDMQGDDGPAVASMPDATPSGDLLEKTNDAPITQLVNMILLDAVKARASDIHVEPFEDTIKVRYRVDGVLHEHSRPPKHLQASLISRLKVMSQMDISEKRLPQDGVARVHIGEREIDVRVSTLPVAEGERIVLRLLDRQSTRLPLGELGMSKLTLGRFRRLLGGKDGIILVTGPTGSGKTTSLYAGLQELDSARRNILTIEDPIEYQLSDIGQMQVKPKIGLSFADGLRHILRQDPDVILVGETRDLETAEIAIRASLTGHLVFTTLHTNDAPSAIVRLIDMGVQPYLLAASVRAIVAQRLVRRLCKTCHHGVHPTAEDLKHLGPAAKRLEGQLVWAAGECESCREGYHGRVGIYELLTMDESLQQLIRDGVTGPDQVRNAAREMGMAMLMDDAVDKILAGATSVDEVTDVLGHVV